MMKAEVGDNLNIKANPQYEWNNNNLKAQTNAVNLTCWKYWDDYYYPKIIHDSYPVYIRERAEDKGKKAFELIKVLKDKKLLQIKTVEDFIEAMTTLIDIL